MIDLGVGDLAADAEVEGCVRDAEAVAWKQPIRVDVEDGVGGERRLRAALVASTGAMGW
ncbi:MAG TPA: hypothetical protein VFY91_00560 [Microbacterium sp.]|nr:hypothetical protein [Microbacterium sp.]